VYTTTIADILARYHRQCGHEVFFLTGTDEHAAKVVDAAAERGLTPQQWADRNATSRIPASVAATWPSPPSAIWIMEMPSSKVRWACPSPRIRARNVSFVARAGAETPPPGSICRMPLPLP
jgi:hypothetical protein